MAVSETREGYGGGGGGGGGGRAGVGQGVELFSDSKIGTIWEVEHNLASDYSQRYPSKHAIQSLNIITVGLISF